MSKKITSRQNETKTPRPKRVRGVFVWLFIVVVTVGLANIFFNNEPQVEQTVTNISHQIVPKKKPSPVPTEPQRDKDLEKILSKWAAAHPNNTWSISVSGLGDDLRYGQYKPNAVYSSASIYKLLLMYPLFQKISLSEAKTTPLSVSGYSRNILDCVSLALKISDNPCGHAIGAYVGWSNADAQLRKIGLKYTSLSTAAGSQTSSGDTAIYLKKLYNDELLDKSTKNYILDAMQHGTWRDGIPAGCEGCIVSNKTGDLGVRHDAAIIKDGNDSYVLVIFTSGASYSQIAQLTGQIQAHMRDD